MTGRTIAGVAAEMRQAQKRYFQKRDQADLVAAKRLEKELDALLEDADGFVGNIRPCDADIVRSDFGERLQDAFGATIGELGFAASWNVEPAKEPGDFRRLFESASALLAVAQNIHDWAFLNMPAGSYGGANNDAGHYGFAGQSDGK